jgi:hypothetical protein
MSCAKCFYAVILCLPLIFGSPDLLSGSQESPSRTQSPSVEKNKGEELLARVWKGVQDAQTRYSSGCGRITETRTSKLLVRPLVFRGRFCASGTEKFQLEYFEPEPVRLVFNRQYLNVTTGRETKNTEVLDIGAAVARTQRYFSTADSIRNLKSNFVIDLEESAVFYKMKLVPRSQRFKQRVNYVAVVLRKNDFLLRTLEIDGKSGVNSVFSIEMDALNADISEDVYKVHKPK